MRRVSADEREETLAMIVRVMAIEMRYRAGWTASVCVDGSDRDESKSYDNPHDALAEALGIYERIKHEELEAWLEH